MEVSDREERMLPFIEQAWNELIPEGEKPISHLLKMDVPVYFKVDQFHHLVYRFFGQELQPMDEAQRTRMVEISWASATPDGMNGLELPRRGFSDGLAYLRLDNRSLEEVAHSGSCKTPRFSRWGLAAARTYRVTGHDRRGRPTKQPEETTTVSDLAKVEFEEAFVIDKIVWDRVKRSDEGVEPLDPLGFLANTEVHKNELFLDAIDVARLRQEVQEQVEMVECPFADRERRPGIYWMFQAAYHFNHPRSTNAKGVDIKAWLKRHGKDSFGSSSLRTAEKFVRVEVNRSQGGPDRGRADLAAIKDLGGDREDYEFPFVGKYFSMILAITDWWVALRHREPDSSTIELARIFMENKFAGHEVGDLVYLISGERISPEQNDALREWAGAKGNKARDVVYIDKRRRAPV